MELDSAKAVSPEGGGRPSCSWAGRLLRRKGPAGRQQPQTGAGYSRVLPTPANSNPAKGQTAKGGSQWGCAALRSWERELHGTFRWSSVTGERGISHGHSGFGVVACTDTSSTMVAGRSVNLWLQEPLWREIPHTSASSHKCQHLLVGGPSPGVTTDMGYPNQARPKFNHAHRHQGLPI